MKKVKAVISLIMITSAIMFYGCSNSNVPQIGNSGNSIKSANVINEKLSLNYNGKSIHIIVWESSKIPNKDNPGSQAALLSRMEDTEKKLNCKIEWDLLSRDKMKDIIVSLKSGNQISDIMYLYPEMSAFELARDNYMLPLDEYLDFNNNFTVNPRQKCAYINGKNYGIVDVLPGISCMFSYNQSIIQENGFENPYELMKDNRWTWDAFLDIVRKTTSDLDGDGIVDRWGVLDNGFTSVVDSFIYSNSGDFTRVSNNNIMFTLSDQSALEAINFTAELYNVHKVMRNKPVMESSLLIKDFNENKGTFIISPYIIQNNVGYVLYPRGPQAQTYSSYQKYGYFFAVASTAPNPVVAANVLGMLFPYYDTESNDYIDVYANFKARNKNYSEFYYCVNSNYCITPGSPTGGISSLITSTFDKIVKEAMDDVQIEKEITGISHEAQQILDMEINDAAHANMTSQHIIQEIK